MNPTNKRPNPPLSLAHLQSDLAILEAALKRLVGFARPAADTDLTRPQTRIWYHLARARAITLEALGRTSA